MESAERKRLPRLVRYLPFLVLVAVGLAIWKTGYLPKDRTLVWRLPDDSSIRSVEVQLWDGDSLLKRETFFFQNGPPERIEEKLRIGRGDYRVQVWITREGQPPISGRGTLRVRGASLVEGPLPTSNGGPSP